MNNQEKLERVAGNGLLHRRHLLGLGALGMGTLMARPLLAADNAGLSMPAWSRMPGPGPSDYGQPSPHAADYRRLAPPSGALSPGSGSSRSPLELLQGSITPNSLHFERHHAGVPAIDPAQHRLVINGLVRQPLAFAYEDLLRYPMVSRIHFLECSGNSGALTGSTAPGGSAGAIHGLVSCAEWTGIPLSVLLDEAGISEGARWIQAVGADAASMGRSIPLGKALDDVLVALFQNGEPVRPEQGYPMRLFVPGWEGNVSVKWLTQIKLAESPAQFRDETSKYTDTLANRQSLQFTFPMGSKSVITAPSGDMLLKGAGIYQISGIAWSGHGSIRRVEVSADGGRSWADAELQSDVKRKALVRFRLPWQWQGGPAVLQSRATDERGNVQPSRDSWMSEVGTFNRYHFNGIQSWAVNSAGEVSNVYA
ncbi:MAG: sulfite dehydrogenase [Pseudomonadota bacterium]|jgi:sulfane dehydrogenase subunit SoxC